MAEASEPTPEIEPLPEGAEYPALDRARWFAIVARGTMAFRFGPFDGPAIGEIMTQCTEEGIPLMVTADCGMPFDWETARAMRGEPGEADEDAVTEAPVFTPAQEARLAELFAASLRPTLQAIDDIKRRRIGG